MEQNYLQTRGRIFDIQRFSVHDGPGIRTIIFLKGCPLRCRWCCNPESQHHQVEEMVVDGKPKTMGRDVTVAEVLSEVLKDASYYRRSGGGVTLSGGECLFQPEFAAAILRACQEHGVNTAIETTAYTSWEKIELVLPYVDYVLMDIKQVDDKKHQEFTGKSNRLILENARKLAQSGVDLTIRVPVIPTFNNTPQEIYAIAKFAESLPGVTRLHLLPYHRLGEDKYTGLGRDYRLKEIKPQSNEALEELREVARQTRLHCQIGG